MRRYIVKIWRPYFSWPSPPAYEANPTEPSLPYPDQVNAARQKRLVETRDPALVDLDTPLFDQASPFRGRGDQTRLLENLSDGGGAGNDHLALVDVGRQRPLLMDPGKVRRCHRGARRAVIEPGDGRGQALLRVHRMPSAQTRQLVVPDSSEELEVPPHEVIRYRHELAVDVLRSLVDADV